ncbi:MAG: GtrA family protein [Spirochaetales bacterium]|nr:GtrA family protein [Spirochaetales bacterium]
MKNAVMRFLHSPEFGRMVRYGMVGILNTALFALCSWGLSRFGWHYALYTFLSYGIAILFSFVMNRFFTFQAKAGGVGTMFGRFLLVTFSLLGAVQGIQYLLIDVLALRELYGVGIGMVFYTGLGYVLNRLWVFQQNP